MRAIDLDSWLRDPRINERGFAHRWKSQVAGGNGEDAFISLVEQHLHPDSDLLDVGCGHGELTLTLASRCRSIVGIERDPGYFKLANELAAERGVTNIRFFQVNLAGPDEPDRPFAGIPLPDASIDLIINRRGPILRRYLVEAIRVTRQGAAIVGLHPTGNATPPPWRGELPDAFQDVFNFMPFEQVATWVTEPLDAAGISDYSLWWIDVPEFLRDTHELYERLAVFTNLPTSTTPPRQPGDELPVVPPYEQVEAQLQSLFSHHTTPDGLVVRHCRLLWQAILRS